MFSRIPLPDKIGDIKEYLFQCIHTLKSYRGSIHRFCIDLICFLLSLFSLAELVICVGRDLITPTHTVWYKLYKPVVQFLPSSHSLIFFVVYPRSSFSAPVKAGGGGGG